MNPILSPLLPPPSGFPRPVDSSAGANPPRRERGLFAVRQLTTWLAALACLLLATASVRADRVPANCTGSGLGINLFTSIPDVHVGDTLRYSVNVFNGIPNSGQIVCDATGITAFIVTPDGVNHPIALVRTTLHQGEADFYPDVVSYVVRAQDIQPDGTLLATARDVGAIHQNDTDSVGGGFQGVNTEVNLPCVLISAFCLPGVGENGAITISGTVTNCGNNTLVGVVVTNFHDGGSFTIVFTNNLARGQVASFTGSYVPINPCVPSTAVLTVRATDEFTATPRTVTNFTTVICQNTLTPGILVTKVCPAGPVSPGQLLTFSGTVRNTGDVTLNNIVVVNNQPSANTQVFTLASLAPGAVASFTGSYLAPTNCSVSDTLVATATSRCGGGVSSTASATCPILTTPGILVTAVCPASPVVAGGAVTYSGTVRNTGDITLNNVVVVSDQPAPNTAVFSVASLAPGAVASFTSTFAVPANACAVTATFRGTGRDVCTLNSVTNTVSTTCFGTTAPAIAVTLLCPVTPASTGGAITYTGTVRNTGNVQLNNVTVVSGQTVPATVLTLASLAPGASASFTATFTAPADACAVTSTVVASGNDNCSGAPVANNAAATCTLVTTPGLALVQICPAFPAVPGGPVNYTGTVRNSGDITLTNVVVRNNLSGSTPLLTLPVLAPGAVVAFSGTYTAPTNCAVTSTSTATAGSVCGVPVATSVNSTCPILTTPGILVTAACPATPAVPGGPLTYTGTVRNSGDITLTNVVVVSDQPAPNTAVFSVASLAPGAVANFTTTFTFPANTCATTTLFRGTGQDVCTLNSVTNTATTTCAVLTAPGIAVTLACPAVPVTAGGLISYTGTVRNTGNVTLNNVFVVNSQPVNNSPVIGPLTLAPGASASFTATFTSPADACSVSSTVTASGNDNCAGGLVANSASATCALVTTPAIVITQACPVAPVVPGSLLTYTGTVRNAGNVTLTNVVVVNNQSGAAPIFTVATLAPGAVASFTGSYVAPTACLSTSSSTATGGSICGVTVTSTASATCPILTTPAIVVTQFCPSVSVFQGGILTYSGTVSNAGNITLTNVIVASDRPGSNTVIFTLATLAPGATASFTGSYQAPDDCCVVSSTVRASGQGCVGETVTDTATRTCPVIGTPGIVVTKVCPTGPLRPGDLLTYSGSVSNAGNLTLINVTVVNNQPGGGSTVLGPVTMAPGEVLNYTAAYVIPADFCGTDTVTASGLDVCTFLPVSNSVTTTCPVTTAPRLTVTKNCPLLPTPLGTLFTYTGSVSNAGNVTLNNVFVVDNLPAPNTPVIGPITLAPGASFSFSGSYLAPTDCCELIDTVTARGRDVCSGSNVTATATAFCPLLSTPRIVVVQNCPPTPIPMGSVYAFSGYVTNTGNVVLTNVFVFSPQGTNSPVLGPIELAPGESERYFGSYTVPFNTCTVAVTTSGKDGLCGTNVVNNTANCPVATTPQIAMTVACPVSPIVPGGSATYSGTVQNTGNITLVNVAVVSDRPAPNTTVFTVPTLAPGSSASFSGTYTVPANACFVTTTYSATGKDLCTPTTVTNNASTTCTVTTTPVIAVTQTCPPGPVVAGSPVAYTGSVSNAGNITLTNVLVFSSQPSGGGPVLGPITLAPGASAPFAGSYTASGGSNPTTNTTVATNSSSTITTNTSPVITTNTTTTVSTNTTTPTFGTIDPVSGAMVNRFNTESNLHGLMFAEQDLQFGPTLFYATRHPATGPDQMVTIATPTGTITDRFALTAGITNIDALTFAAPDVGHGEVNFYYIRHNVPTVSVFGQIIVQGASSSADFTPVLPNSGYKALAFAEPNLGTFGANLFHYIREDGAGLASMGTISVAGAMVVTDRYTIGTGLNYDAMVYVPGTVSTWGTSMFVYLRHNATGSIIGTIDPVTHVVTDRLSLGTSILSSLAFTATDVGYGPNMFYGLLPERTALTTNTVTTFTTNSVTTFTTNTTTTFTTNSVVTFTPTNTVTATGRDICQARTVSAAANCSGPVAAGVTPQSVSGARLANGNYSTTFPTEIGRAYTVQYKDALSDSAWTDLETVVGTGGNQTVTDSTAAQRPKRFYRIITTP